MSGINLEQAKVQLNEAIASANRALGEIERGEGAPGEAPVCAGEGIDAFKRALAAMGHEPADACDGGA
jgi:hypothetical protein